MKIVCETKRLIIRHFNLSDAEFIVQLLNDKSFIRYIADKNIRNIPDAKKYLTNGPISSYQRYGFGLNLVLLKETKVPIGMCGLLKRDELDCPDVGYALLPEYWGKAYASEAVDSVLKEGIVNHSLNRVLAVTLPDNLASNNLLKRVGFTSKGTMELYGSLNELYEYRV